MAEMKVYSITASQRAEVLFAGLIGAKQLNTERDDGGVCAFVCVCVCVCVCECVCVCVCVKCMLKVMSYKRLI